MATRNLVPNNLGVFVATGLVGATLDDTSPLALAAGEKHISVGLSGTFGGTATVQVSFDGTTWFTAEDIAGAATTTTAAAIFEIKTAARFVRAIVGTGVANVTASIAVARAPRG